MTNQRLITCVHCRSDIPHGASVCKGCRAEIKYGTPGFFMLVGFILPIVVGWYAASYGIKSLGFNETVGYIIWSIITITGWFFATKICSSLFSNYVSFTRLKNQ